MQLIHSTWSTFVPRARPIDHFLTVCAAQTWSLSSDYSPIWGRFLVCLRSAVRRLLASRLRTAEADGRVARRGAGGGLAASSSRSIAVAQAVARLRNCDREPADEAVIVGPAAASTLSRTAGVNPARSTSIVTVTAVSDVLAC